MKCTRFVTLISLSCICGLLSINGYAQAGISVSPSRIYYNTSESGAKAQKIIVTNPSNKPVDIGVSIADWNYDSLGNNRVLEAGNLTNSAAKAIKVLPGSFFTLKPNEQKELTIQYSAIATKNSKSVYHTGMIFFTQLNPGQAVKSNGASIKVTVRMGVKLYHTTYPDETPNLEIVNLKNVSVANMGKFLELTLQNKGKIWADGRYKTELLNASTGTKTQLPEDEFFTLPGDKRILKHSLPENLPKGKYTATTIVTFGKNKDIKVAELEFVL